LLRPALIVSIYLIAWYALDVISLHFEAAPEIQVWYPPSALDVALLLVFGLRYWPALFLNTLLHDVFVTHRHLPWGTLLVFDVVTTLGYWGACALLLRRVRIDPGLSSLRDVGWFVLIAAFAAPFTIGGLQALNFAWSGIIPWPKVWMDGLLYGAGDATGVAMLTPFLLLMFRRSRREDSPLWPVRREAPQALVEMTILGAATGIAYRSHTASALDCQYVVFAPLLWIAARHGFERAVGAVFLFNVVAAFLVWDNVNGANPLPLQFGLMATTYTGILMGAFLTERTRQVHALQAGEERFQAVAQATNDALWDWDLATGAVWRSAGFFTMSGYSAEQVTPEISWWVEHIHPDDHERVVRGIYEAIDGGAQEWAAEYRYRRQDGTHAVTADRGTVLSDDAGRPTRMIGGMSDITERRQAQEALRHQAFYDALTGLPNRALFTDRLGHALEHDRRRPGYPCAVLFLDLDRFKVINDSLGHAAGDQFLVSTARRLASCLRPKDTAARIGGDEFVILLEDFGGEGDPVRVAERVQAEMSRPLELGGQEVSATVSIGIVLMSAALYDRPEDVLRDADIAMYRAKTGGRARCQVFGAEMHAHAVALLRLETDLRRAVEREQFRLHYQPIVSLESGRITGFEALVRWQHPQRGLVGPGEFLPLAEETGLILSLGRWVLREACRQNGRWRRQFPQEPFLTVSINLASRQFAQAALVETITEALEEAGLEASGLGLEITESGIMEDVEAAAMLSRLRDLGVSVSIDDFGTGYSSLSRLHSLPLDSLKIDRSFVAQMNGSDSMIRAVVTLAHGLRIDVVAEGVETAEQLAALRALNCRYGQGYFFSRPLDAAAALLLEAQPRW